MKTKLRAQSSELRNIWLCVLSAVLLVLPFAIPNLWIFAWIGFVPLFMAVQGKSKPKAFLLTYFSGVIFWLGTIYWLTNVTVAGYVVLSLYLALYFGIFGFFISFYSILNTRYSILFISAFWVVLEYLRGHLLTGFPWALLGYSQYKNLPIIQIADITGAYGVSFLVMMGNVLIYRVTGYGVRGKRERQKNLTAVFLLLCVLVYGYYKIYFLSRIPYPVSRTPIKVSLIQPNIPQELKWNTAAKEDIIKKYFRMTQEALKDSPDLIIWPESAVQDYLVIEKEGYANAGYLVDFTQEINKPLLLGMVGLDSQNFYNSAVLFSQDGEIVQRYDKLHLVPFGEYIPLRAALPFLEVVVPIGDFTAGREYVVFETSNALSGTGQKPETRNKFSVLICFEDVLPNLARNFVKKGAGFLVNITNDAWFGDTPEPYQHLAASVFRAVENRVSVVRAANTGVSCFISPQGDIYSKVSNGKKKNTFVEGYISDTVYLSAGSSIYNKYGDVFIWLCFLIAGCGIIIKVKSKKEKGKTES